MDASHARNAWPSCIGLGIVLLIDVCFTYLPNLDAFFAAGGVADPAAYGWYWKAPKANWSLLRGLGDPLISTLGTLLWIGLTIWAFMDAWGRGRPNSPPPLGFGFFFLWALVGFLATAGVWTRTLADPAPRLAWWLTPALIAWVQLVHLPFYAMQSLRGDRRFEWVSPVVALFASVGVMVVGWSAGQYERPAIAPILESWQTHPTLMRLAIWSWIVAASMWTIGLFTRWANVATWVLAMSFANVNPYAENAGDTIRNITLFLLMFAPSGAAWSIDAVFAKRGGDRRPAYVFPWPLALLFLQMTCIYFFNGLYKAGGASWIDGDSLQLAPGDVTLTRFSIARIHPPLWATRIMTWTVLVWELTFPILALFRWSRAIALLFGVGFHLGIGLLMELGSFVPVMLVLYLPFLPWDRWLGENLKVRDSAESN